MQDDDNQFMIKKDDIVSKMDEFPRIIQFSQKIVTKKRDGGEKIYNGSLKVSNKYIGCKPFT